MQLLYSVHFYYSFFGSVPESYYPDEIAYWNAVTPSDFANAKNLLYNNLLQNYGIQDAWNHGHTVFFEETGANIINPHYAQFLNDFWSFCVSHNIGFDALNNDERADPNHTAQYWYPGDIFNVDWSLNGIGASLVPHLLRCLLLHLLGLLQHQLLQKLLLSITLFF